METSDHYFPKILSCYVGDTSVQLPILSWWPVLPLSKVHYPGSAKGKFTSDSDETQCIRGSLQWLQAHSPNRELPTLPTEGVKWPSEVRGARQPWTLLLCSPPRFLIRTRAERKVDTEERARPYCGQWGGRHQDQASGVYQDLSHSIFRDCQTPFSQLLVVRRFSFAFLSLILRTTPWHGDLLHLIKEETGI